MSAEVAKEARNLIPLPIIEGVEFTAADFVLTTFVLAKRAKAGRPNSRNTSAMSDLSLEVEQEANESRKRLEEQGHTHLPEYRITHDPRVTTAIVQYLIPRLDKLDKK